MIDIGLNISSKKFKNDYKEVIENGIKGDVTKFIFTGTSLDSSKISKKISYEYDKICCFTSGLHPHNAKNWNNEKDGIFELAQDPLCVAIGECGLDYDRMLSNENIQKYVLESHMEMALKLNKPLFIHIRPIDFNNESEKKILGGFKEIYAPYKEKGVKGIVHCFTMGSRSLEVLKSLDLYFGITGWICDNKRGKSLQSIVRYIPNNRIMIETDAPYLLPSEAIKLCKNRRNEPKYLNFVLNKVACLKNIDPIKLDELMNKNVKDLFNF